MLKQKRIKYLLLLIPLLFISKVNALTLDTQDITWYYRKTSDESTLLNTIKDIDTPVHIVNGEYLNGFTTRQDYTFSKDLQYMINYKLIMRYYEGIDGDFRSDTVDRLISYSWVDSDFKLLNTSVNQSKYLCDSDLCTREFTISQQVLTLNNTSGIRFGVYTTEAKSIGFYSPSSGSDGVYMYLSSYISIEDNSSSTIIDQNNQIIDGQNSLQNSITNTEDSINQNIDDMEQSIVDSNKETQDVIKDQFNSCRDSYNLFPGWTVGQHYSSSNGLLITGSSSSSSSSFIPVDFVNNSRYYLSNLPDSYNIYISAYDESKSYIGRTASNKINSYLFYPDKISNFGSGSGDINNIKYITITYQGTNVPDNTMLNVGSSAKPYEPFGEEICSNKLDEQNETIKGGFSSIGNWFKELGDKIGNFFENLLNGILDGLKSLFIPEDGYFELWFNDLKMFFEDKLGFLATPFTIIIDFVNRYLNLNSSEDIIINIPDITVPNFEEHIIVKATTFNWSQLLKSKNSLNTLWQLYLSFVDVFLILNFINLCENKYNRIFGGDTTQYEYYTVEDSYNVDVNTGEVKNMRRNERKTTRKKVN